MRHKLNNKLFFCSAWCSSYITGEAHGPVTVLTGWDTEPPGSCWLHPKLLHFVILCTCDDVDGKETNMHILKVNFASLCFRFVYTEWYYVKDCASCPICASDWWQWCFSKQLLSTSLACIVLASLIIHINKTCSLPILKLKTVCCQCLSGQGVHTWPVVIRAACRGAVPPSQCSAAWHLGYLELNKNSFLLNMYKYLTFLN